MSDEKSKRSINISKLDQAAILMMSLGEKEAAEVLKHLGPKDVQRIGTAMTSLENVPQEHVEVVMSNFLNDASTLTGLGMGSDGYIRNMLVEALGEDKAGSLVDRIPSPPGDVLSMT